MRKQSSEKVPIFSIIIPVWPGDDRPYGLDYIDNLNWPHERLEIILARGLQPCRQRNQAVQQATGDILVFFDDDSCPEPDYLMCLAPNFSDTQVAGVGGPNPAVPTERYIPNLVDAVFTSCIGVLSKRARYQPVGRLREGCDSDLIFCNFALRRELYLQLGGLDERLCPNEENEFFERFHQCFPDKKLLYDPHVIACEPRPETIKLFLKKMFGYGRGRARQFKIRPSLWGVFHMLGCLVPIVIVTIAIIGGFWPVLYLFTPYIALLLYIAICCLITNNRRSIAFSIGPAIFATHITYVMGLWKGLFESTEPSSQPETSVELEYYNFSV